MLTETYKQLAELLEKYGCENAMEVITHDLIPLAQEHHVSIDQSIHMFSKDYEAQDTTYYQLWLAMCTMSHEDYNAYKKLDIYRPL